MRTIYIDADYKCHCAGGEGLRAVQTSFFDGKCDAFIEGYRFVAAGAVWTRDDGAAFRGEMIAPWKDYSGLDKAQREYEKQLLGEYAQALKTLGVTV